jgi:molecular chaperone DnaJ
MVDIPPGADTGNRLRLSGAGESGVNGGPPGDLYVFIEVEEHEVFTREGDDIICEAPITFPQAALGAKVKVPSLTGSVELDIPAGTQSGTLMRMRGLGLPNIRTGRRGDQIAQVIVEVPTRLTPEQRELLEKLAEISGHDTYPRSESFMDKVRAFLGGD